MSPRFELWKNDAQFWTMCFRIDWKFIRIRTIGALWWTPRWIFEKFWIFFFSGLLVEAISESFRHQIRMNMGVMIPINSDNFYFETKQEKIQMKKIFFVLFVIVILMISFLIYDNKIRQLDLKNHKTISLMNQIIEFRWVWWVVGKMDGPESKWTYPRLKNGRLASHPDQFGGHCEQK